MDIVETKEVRKSPLQAIYNSTDKLSIRKIDKASAKKMVVKYHYSHLWTKCSVALGLFYDTGKQHAFFDEAEEKMIGVIVYGDPVGRNSGSSIAEGLEHTQVYELARLYIHDGYGNNIESWFISHSFVWLKNNFSHKLINDLFTQHAENFRNKRNTLWDKI